MDNHFNEFEISLSNINELIDLPKSTQEIALQLLNSIDKNNLKPQEQLQLNNCIGGIQNISDGSFGAAFKIIYNQVCILGVSALSAYVEKYFQEYAQENIDRIIQLADVSKLKITLKELSGLNLNIHDNIGQIIINKGESINFQDLQSILRSFQSYLDKSITMPVTLKDDIIFYQQCRHVLVHNNGVVNDEFMRKVGTANKKGYSATEQVQLDKDDWTAIQRSFLEFYKLITT